MLRGKLGPLVKRAFEEATQVQLRIFPPHGYFAVHNEQVHSRSTFLSSDRLSGVVGSSVHAIINSMVRSTHPGSEMMHGTQRSERCCHLSLAFLCGFAAGGAGVGEALFHPDL